MKTCSVCQGEGVVEAHEQPINYPDEKNWEICEECNATGTVYPLWQIESFWLLLLIPNLLLFGGVA